MLTALVLICDMAAMAPGAGAGECTPDRAVFVGTVPGRWADVEACRAGAVAYLHGLDVSAALVPDHDYAITVACQQQKEDGA